MTEWFPVHRQNTTRLESIGISSGVNERLLQGPDPLDHALVLRLFQYLVAETGLVVDVHDFEKCRGIIDAGRDPVAVLEGGTRHGAVEPQDFKSPVQLGHQVHGLSG